MQMKKILIYYRDLDLPDTDAMAWLFLGVMLTCSTIVFIGRIIAVVFYSSMGVRDSNGVSKGGKCWFAVESKSFEISIEEIRGRLRGTIWERSKGLSSWIRFGEKGLSLLLEGVEAWCRGESNSKLLKVWDEGARKFKLECRFNVAGRFLLCSVRDVERKKFCLVFPEGNGLVGGWFLLAKNLRALGVSSTEVRNSY